MFDRVPALFGVYCRQMRGHELRWLTHHWLRVPRGTSVTSKVWAEERPTRATKRVQAVAKERIVEMDGGGIRFLDGNHCWLRKRLEG